MFEHLNQPPPEDVATRFQPTLNPLLLEDPEDADRLYCLSFGEFLQRLRPDRPFAELSAHPGMGRRFSASMEDLFASNGSFMRGLAAKLAGDLYQLEYAYPVLSTELLDRLAAFIGGRKLLDAGAGLGTTSRLLKQRGVNAVASDQDDWYPPILERNLDHVGDSISLLPGDFDVVLLSWPPHQRPFGSRIVKTMRPGQILIHMGEWGGCTGDAKLDREIRSEHWIHDDEATGQINEFAVQIYGLHDHWDVFEKR